MSEVCAPSSCRCRQRRQQVTSASPSPWGPGERGWGVLSFRLRRSANPWDAPEDEQHPCGRRPAGLGEPVPALGDAPASTSPPALNPPQRPARTGDGAKRVGSQRGLVYSLIYGAELAAEFPEPSQKKQARKTLLFPLSSINHTLIQGPLSHEPAAGKA